MAQTVRFAVPFATWCTTCSTLLAKGRRFNAEKSKNIGEYLNLEVFTFDITCPSCSTTISYQTDPERCCYRLKGETGKEKSMLEIGSDVKDDNNVFKKMEERYERAEKLKMNSLQIETIIKKDTQKMVIPEHSRRMMARRSLRRKRRHYSSSSSTTSTTTNEDNGDGSKINGPEHEDDVRYAKNLFS